MGISPRHIDVPEFGNVVYRREGSGSPVVLLHGFLGSSMYWEELIRSLSCEFDVIAPDLPGFGESTDAIAADSMEAFAEFVNLFANTIGIRKFGLVGHSMGGAIAQQYTMDHEATLDRLVLYGTSSSGILRDRFESFEASIHRLEVDGVNAHADRVVPTWFRNGQDDVEYETCRNAVGSLRLDAAISAQRAIARWNLSNQLNRIRTSTLVIAGDGDRSCNPRESFSLWSRIDGAQLFIAPGCCHAVHLEKRHLFEAVLKEFLVGDRVSRDTSCT